MYSWKYETWFAWMRRLLCNSKITLWKENIWIEVLRHYYCKQTKKLLLKNIVIGSFAPSLQMVFLRVYPTLWAFHRLKQLLESPQAFDFNNNVNGRSSENYATYWKTSEHHHLLHILHLTAKERQNVLFPHIFDITSNRLQAEQRWNPQSLH